MPISDEPDRAPAKRLYAPILESSQKPKTTFDLLRNSISELEVDLAKAQYEHRQTTAQTLQKAIEEKKSQIQALEQKLQRLPELEQEIKAIKEKISSQAVEIQELENQVRQKEIEIIAIGTELAKEEQLYQQVESGARELKEDLERAGKEGRINTASVLEVALRERQKVLDEKKAKVEDLRSKLSKGQQEKTSYCSIW
jgi:chromosome segregation ATPase